MGIVLSRITLPYILFSMCHCCDNSSTSEREFFITFIRGRNASYNSQLFSVFAINYVEIYLITKKRTMNRSFECSIQLSLIRKEVSWLLTITDNGCRHSIFNNNYSVIRFTWCYFKGIEKLYKFFPRTKIISNIWHSLLRANTVMESR